MSDLKGFYDNFPEDRRERKKRKKSVYSSKDFIPGTKGILIKLIVSFTIFLISTSFIIFILSNFMYLHELSFVMYFSAVMMVISWGISVLLKNAKNIIRILIILVFICVAYLFSPHTLLVTAIVLIYNFIISFLTLKRLNLPERLALSLPLVLSSYMFFVFFQLAAIMNPNKTESAIQAEPFLMTVGVVWIIVSLFLMTYMNINNAFSGRKLSKSLVAGNVTLTALFVGFVLLVSNIGAYKDLIFGVIRKILLLLVGEEEISEVPLESETPQGGGMDFSKLAEGSETSLFWELMEKLFLIIGVIVIALIAYFLIKTVIKAIRGLSTRFMDYLKGNDATTSILTFEDKEESIFDKKRFNDAISNRWNKIVKSFKRKAKLSDMKNNRQKVRFLYKRLLENKDKDSTTINRSATAREYLIDGDATMEKESFIQGYEKARYSEHDVTNEEVRAGLEIIGK